MLMLTFSSSYLHGMVGFFLHIQLLRHLEFDVHIVSVLLCYNKSLPGDVLGITSLKTMLLKIKRIHDTFKKQKEIWVTEFWKQSPMPLLTLTHNRSKTKPGILHNTADLEWHSTLCTADWSSLSDQSPAPEPGVRGMHSCWRTHPSSLQPAVWPLQGQPLSVLWSAASPQWVRACVCVWLGRMGVTIGRLQPGVKIKLTRVELHSHVNTHPYIWF